MLSGISCFYLTPCINFLIKGDIITEVNRDKITTVDSFVSIVEELHSTGRNSLLLKIIREKQSLWVTINFVN